MGSSSVESHIHIQHFLMPVVDDLESGGGLDVCSSEGLSSFRSEGEFRRTVSESSEFMAGVDERGGDADD